MSSELKKAAAVVAGVAAVAATSGLPPTSVTDAVTDKVVGESGTAFALAFRGTSTPAQLREALASIGIDLESVQFRRFLPGFSPQMPGDPPPPPPSNTFISSNFISQQPPTAPPPDTPPIPGAPQFAELKQASSSDVERVISQLTKKGSASLGDVLAQLQEVGEGVEWTIQLAADQTAIIK